METEPTFVSTPANPAKNPLVPILLFFIAAGISVIAYVMVSSKMEKRAAESAREEMVKNEVEGFKKRAKEREEKMMYWRNKGKPADTAFTSSMIAAAKMDWEKLVELDAWSYNQQRAQEHYEKVVADCNRIMSGYSDR